MDGLGSWSCRRQGTLTHTAHCEELPRCYTLHGTRTPCPCLLLAHCAPYSSMPASGAGRHATLLGEELHGTVAILRPMPTQVQGPAQL